MSEKRIMTTLVNALKNDKKWVKNALKNDKKWVENALKNDKHVLE